ncbi:HlyD family secretion protein [Paracoccus chinensis]|uniref:Multidrug resistance efflux pump n=1 Tax=Paracoccus chinensis TaxID=525640 RepID=A0A1G9MXF7_9RHOB|nr:HlyD family secretion protein [Paracoccus chinensis]SDL78950.1 Multidrug resistance efflux pump [Paracoccus chinensis]
MNKTHLLPTFVIALIGIAGVLLILFAWHLPPFAPTQPTTENAYVRGRVTSIAPQLSGYLSEVDVQDFQQVRQGDLIARIDDRIFRQKLAQAEAALSAARAALAVAEQTVRSSEAVQRADEAALASTRAALATAESDFSRAQELSARGVSSETSREQAALARQQATAAVQQAEAQLEVQVQAIESARAQVSARQADIASAGAAVELARIDLANTEIHAPEDGRLGQVSARLGQYVTAGTALVPLVGPDIWIVANFPETGVHGMRLGQAVDITVDALQDRHFTGRVDSFSPATASEFSLLAGSNATGNFTKIVQRLPVRISIDPGQEMGEYLAPGLSVIVRVATGAS